MKVTILNGPNLNLLGTRDPAIYGSATLGDIGASCAAKAASLGLTLAFHQTNHEGELVEMVQACRDQDGLILNAGAYTHTSIAIHDALEVLTCPIVEVHLSAVHRREAFRQHSFIAPQATGLITGLGAQGYELALEAIAGLAADR